MLRQPEVFMEYVSTRDKSRKVSASYAIANGIAPDVGLYCPTSSPALTAEDWHALANLDYKGRSALVLGKFLTDFSGEELADYAAKAYADNKFGGADTAPVVSLADGKHMLELWHGPTCAFKDFALQLLHAVDYDPDIALQLLREAKGKLFVAAVCVAPTRRYDNKWRPVDRRGCFSSKPYPSPRLLKTYTHPNKQTKHKNNNPTDNKS